MNDGFIAIDAIPALAIAILAIELPVLALLCCLRADRELSRWIADLAASAFSLEGFSGLFPK